jgi:hypothetical protein
MKKLAGNDVNVSTLMVRSNGQALYLPPFSAKVFPKVDSSHFKAILHPTPDMPSRFMNLFVT